MTPDELRELLIPNTAITSDEVRRRISAAADAWDLALVARYAIEEKYRALVKRLEAAETWLKKIYQVAADVLHDHEEGRDSELVALTIFDWAQRGLAALTGEE